MYLCLLCFVLRSLVDATPELAPPCVWHVIAPLQAPAYRIASVMEGLNT